MHNLQLPPLPCRLPTTLLLVALFTSTFTVTGISDVAHAEPQPRLITVSGEAEVRVAPDEVTITLGVETSDADLAGAARKNSEQVRQVQAMAREFKIDPKDLGTDQISLDKHFEYINGKNQFKDYQARRTISLRLKDLSRFEELLIAAMRGGATSIQSVQFCTSQLRKHRDSARASALKAAAEKAADMTKQLGQRVGRPHSISEMDGSWSFMTGARGAMYGNAQNIAQAPAGSAGDSPGVGLITVSAKVSVAFELE